MKQAMTGWSTWKGWNTFSQLMKLKSLMLSSCGSRTYKLFRSLLTLVNPGEASCNDLKETIENHQNPKPSVTVERFKFNKRDGKMVESVPCYMAELHILSEDCRYNNNLDEGTI